MRLQRIPGTDKVAPALVPYRLDLLGDTASKYVIMAAGLQRSPHRPVAAQLPGHGQQAGPGVPHHVAILLPLCSREHSGRRTEAPAPPGDTAGFIAPIAHQAHWRDRKCPPGAPGRWHLPSCTYPAAFGPRVSYGSRQPLKHKRQKGKDIWRRSSCCQQPRPSPVSFGFSCSSA